MGEISSLASSGLNLIIETAPFLNLLWSGPFQIVIAIIYLWSYLNIASLVGKLSNQIK